MVFGLRLAVLGFELSNEFLPTIPEDDRYEVRMQGLEKMNDGMLTALAGAMTSLSRTNFYSDENLTLILATLNQTLPTFKRVLPQEDHAVVKSILSEQKSRFKGGDLRLIESMLKTLGAQ